SPRFRQRPSSIQDMATAPQLAKSGYPIHSSTGRRDSFARPLPEKERRSMTDSNTRIEKDPLGELAVPADALYGVQTLRAVQNFPISGLKPMPAFIDAAGSTKKEAAMTHRQTGRLEARLADAIIQAADEVLAGKHRDQFVVDVYQAAASTSHNMNINEVLANRANELLGGKRGEYAPVHPNDHVNMAQSTNDV